ncbi:microtubule-actin cross-linking factor 1, isoforms 6/7-like [Oncorhynchus nerka]|uniref:microtubule-actin cross-linking factor 1, isoforms 6/7-like n=1 Tax=Oncorhynchus nerka TaxID=8023 RepID=UPI0031B85DBC
MFVTFHGTHVSKTCQQSSLEQGDIPSSFLRLTKLEIQILLNDVKQSINHMQGTLNTMQGQCIELQTAISKVVSDESQIQKNKSMMGMTICSILYLQIITPAEVAVQREEIVRASGLIPSQRKGILQTASVPSQREGILSAASINAQREEILRSSGLIPARREGILQTASVTAQREEIVPMASVPVHREGIVPRASVPAEREEILRASGLIPAQRKGILQTASVPAHREGILRASGLIPSKREGILPAASITAQKNKILRASQLTPAQRKLILLMTSVTAQRKGIFPKASVPAHREWIVPKAGVPAEREEILLTASVPVKNENNHPQPPPIIPMVAPLWKWDGGACTPPVDFYSKRRDVRLRYVEHPAMMSITKPEHSDAKPQFQTGTRPVAEPETPAVHNNSGGWLSWVFGSGRANKKEVHLPEDKDRSIVWDPTLHRWVNKTEPKAEVHN